MSYAIPSAPATEAPLETMAKCHERLARQCSILRRLVPYLAECGRDDAALDVVRAVIRHFDRSAPLHYADEEEDLFPALLESMAGSDAVCLRDLTQSLANDHRLLRAAWTRLRAALQRVLAGEANALIASEVEAFIELQEVHSEREDGELLPMAARLLDDDALARIGQAMSRRRKVQVPLPETY